MVFESLPLLGFIFASIIIELTPGPNMAYLAILTTADGRRAGFAAVAGVASGLLCIGLAAAAGLATLIEESPPLYHALRWGGVAYMLWLAWEGWRGEEEISRGPSPDERRKYFLRGFITNLLNPKAFLFFVAALPNFLSGDENVLQQTVRLTFVYVAVATCVHSLIVLLADASRTFFESRNPVYVRKTLSLLLVLVAVWMAWKTA